MKTIPELPKKTISVFQVSMILLGARHQGLDVGSFLQASGIAADLMTQPRARVTQRQYARLMVTLARTMRDEFLGLGSRPLPMGTFASCCRMIVSEATLGDALRAGFRFLHPLLSDFTPRLRVRDGLAYCELQDKTELTDRLRYARRVFMYFSYGLSCWLVEKRIPLSKVFYGAQEQVIPTEAMQLFQAPIGFRAEGVGYCFPAQWLQLPVLQNSQTVEPYIKRAPSDMLVMYRDQKSMAERVRRLIRKDLDDASVTLEQIARTLSTTPQTLRRRLAVEGCTFRELKNDLRRDVAIELLSDPSVKVSDIANRLGFSEVATFHRAFREWTGTTPKKLQISML